jgi:glutathione S-transferase
MGFHPTIPVRKAATPPYVHKDPPRYACLSYHHASHQMPDHVMLLGYRSIAYTRIAVDQKGGAYTTVEVDPFSNPHPPQPDFHLFGRVPVLSDGGFTLFETTVITRYIEAAFDGPPVQPATIQAQARMDQALSIIDSYGYCPMVRHIFAHRAFRPLGGEPSNEENFAAGLRASEIVLTVLDRFASAGLILPGQTITLADCHLIPMIDTFCHADEGRAALSACSALSRWWCRVSTLPMVTQTDPNLANP